MKRCPQCKKKKQLQAFSKSKATKDGHQGICKVCKTRIYYTHREEVAAYNHKYQTLHKKRLSIYHNEYQKHRRRTRPEFRITQYLRIRMWLLIRKGYKSASTLALIGCTAEELKRHIEKQFISGMSWGNYGKGGWDIDHVIPCASFDLTDPVQQQQCFHYSNLQPLWHGDNMRKGSANK